MNRRLTGLLIIGVFTILALAISGCSRDSVKAKSNDTFPLLPPGMYDQTASQGVAQTYFTAHKNVNVFASFGDQMSAGGPT